MPTGYRLEIASRSQASCNGRKPCKGSKIEKGTLRLGTWVEIQGHGAFKWRHWGCTTPEVIGHLKRDFEKPSDVDGFEELPEMYQEKFIKAWEVEHVEDEDIPATARLPTPPPGEEGEAETPKKKTPKKAKQPADGEADGDKPKKPRKTTKKVKKEDSASELTEDEEEKEEKPKKKAPAKKAKKEPDLEEEHVPAKANGKKGKTGNDDEEVKPAKSNGKRGKAVKEEVEEDEEKPAKATKKPKIAKAKAEPAAKPAKKRPAKTVVKSESEEE